jgi:cell filamentation protein, protein adenylyltransferase
MTKPVLYHLGKFPPSRLDWPQLISLIGPANAALARYDGLLAAIPNASVLLSPLTTHEAVLSSRIEGTQATMGEVLEYEARGTGDAIDPHKRNDIEEVLNYRQAMRQATAQMKSLPLCNRLVKSVHETLLAGVRGHDKARGRFRSIQNYIGVPGRPIEEARFIPIAPEEIEAGMTRWERYLHEPAEDILVQLAIVHAEFESLHPFLDGNGRIGRILIPLFLYDRKLLNSPMFYLSEYLEANRQEYYDRLLAVSRDDDWTGWCRFFLQALRQQAANNEAKARQILDLYQRQKDWIVDRTHSHHAIRALDFLFCTPVFNASDFIEKSKIPDATARRILTVLSTKGGLLKTLRESSGRRPAVYAFAELLNITEGRTIF